MKKILTLIAVVLFTAMSAYSQQPASGFSNIFNYQGVARNSVGNVLVNKSIALRLTVHDVNPGGPVVYQETRGVVTNPFGLFNVQVGSIGATNVTGTIAGVNWAVNNKYIQVEIDPNGGSTFINIGTAQIAFVPYALYSSLAGDLVLPFNKTQANAGTLFTITNSGTGISGSIMGITNSPAANAWGVHGQVNNSSAGGFSTGVLGTNLSTTGLGIGVTGTQNGGGWGVYGTAPNGIGVNGASTSGNGVNGSSVTGAGGRFVTTGTGQALFTTGALRFQGILEGSPNPPNFFKILAGDATGNASWQHASAIGLVSGSGTLNFVPKWTPNGTTLGNSQIFDDGTQVGVGTITPFARLTVVQNNSGINLGGGAATGSEIKFLNSGTSHMSIYNRGNNALTFAQTSALSQTNTLGSPLMTLTSGGNLGIGTTTPLHTLEVQGIERINATTVQEGGELRFQEGSLFGAPNHWIIDNFQSFAGGNKFRLWNDVGGMNIQMMPGGKTAIGNMIFSDQPRSTLDVEGNLAVGAAYSGTTAAPVNGAIIEGSVGIGIAAPLDKLHVAGTVAQVRIEDTDNASTLWLSAPGTGYTGGVGMLTNHDLPLFTNNTDRVVIKAGTGFVGVGTATPISRLHVAGQATIQDGTQGIGRIFFDNGAGVGTGKWETAAGAGLVSGSGTLNFIPKWTPTGTNLGNSQFFDDGTNVGLGTITPIGKFNVNSGNAFLNTNLRGNSNAGTWLSMGNTDPGGRWFNIVNTASGNGEGPGKLVFFQGGAANLATGSIMTLVHSSLNVGINTNNPLDKLHVNSSTSFATQTLEALSATNAGPHLRFLSGSEFSYIDYIRSDYLIGGFAHRQGSLELRGGNRLNFYPNGGLVGSADLAMTVISNGHVGIGKVTPTARLDVLNSTPADRAAQIALTDPTNNNQAVIISTARNIIESSFVSTALTALKGPGAIWGSSGPATIYSTSRDAHGMVGSSDNGIGVFGIGINGAAMQATSVGTAPGLNVFAIGGGNGINVFHNQPTGLGVSIQKFDPSNLNPGLDVFNAGDGTAGNFLSTTGKAIFGQTNGITGGLNAIHGFVSSSSPGGFSTGLRGENNGTGGLGIGVWGSQNGSGWGVLGNTPSGLGVYGSTNSGIGVYGDANTGWGMRAISNTNTAIYSTSNSGFGGDFRSQTNIAGLFQTTDLTNNVRGAIQTYNPSRQQFARALYAQGSGYSGYYWTARQVAEIQSDSTVGIGIISRFNNGIQVASETGAGIYGFIFNNTGFGNAAVLGQSSNPNSHGLYGIAPNGGIGRALATNGPLQLTGIGEANNYVLASDAVGNANWKSLSAIGGVSGSGTLNFVPKWTPSGVFLGNSQIFDNGFGVGIGTATPGFKLHVADNFPEVLVQDIDDNTSISLIPRGTGYTGGVGTRGNNDLPLFTNNLDRVTIKAGTGDVGVNTFTPFMKMHVNSGNNFNTSLLEAQSANNAGPHQYFYSGGEFSMIDYIRTDYTVAADAHRRGAMELRGVSRLNLLPTNATDLVNGMTIRSNGNVGIGTASPLFKVDVSSTVAVQRLIDTDDGTIFGIAAPGAGYSGGVGTVTNHDLAIFSNNLDRMTVRANGDVGVGITTPTNKFEVLQTGTTRAGLFQVNNPASFATAFEVNSNATAIGIHAQSNTPGFCNCGVIDGLTNITGANAVFGRGIGSNTWGVYGLSDSSAGVAGIGFRAGSVGVYGQGWRGTAGQFIIDNTFSGNTSNTLEVSNTQTGKAANFSINNAASTSDVIFATTNGFGNAIETFSDKSTSIVGRTGLNAGYGSAGVMGINNSVGGNGFYGIGNRFDDWGILAHSDSSLGVYGESYYDRAGYFVNFGLNNTTANTVEIINAGKGHGVYAQTSHYNQLANFYNPATAFKAAGYFNGNTGTGVIGHAAGTFTHTAGGRVGVGVYGVADSVGANFNYGVVGVGRGSVGENAGIAGYVDGSSGGTFNAAIYGFDFGGPGSHYAGYFQGNVQVIGNFAATGSKAFKIDHPLDPSNKYLSHFAMESPEVQNVYNGNVITDANGKASIKLPDYFSSINKDFKYQLTVVDETQFAMARVSKKINGNNFEIMTSVPNMEVSWQVTAIRNDKAAQKFVEPAETLKLDGEKGRYLNPELYGLGKEKGIAGMTGIANLPGPGETLKTATPVTQTSDKIMNLQKQALSGMTNEQNQNAADKVTIPVLPKPEIVTEKTGTQVNTTSPDNATQKSKVLASSLKPVEEVEYKSAEMKQATLTEAEMQQQQSISAEEQKRATEEIRKSWNNEGKPSDPSVKQLPASLSENKLPKQTDQTVETKPAAVNNNTGKLLPPNSSAGAGLLKANNAPKLPGDENKVLQNLEKSQGSIDKLKEATNQDNKQIKTPVMPDTKQAGMEKAPVQKKETKLQAQSQQSPELQKPVQPGPLKQVPNDALKEKTKTD